MALVTIRAEADEKLSQLVQQAQGKTSQPVLVVYREKSARIYLDAVVREAQKRKKN